jgi:hypothetical protein
MTRSPTSKTWVENINMSDSNNVCAECPKMNENPKVMVARGTRLAKVLCRLKISKQTKIMPTKATANNTASSFATTELTSYENAQEPSSARCGEYPTFRLDIRAFRSLYIRCTAPRISRLLISPFESLSKIPKASC